MLKTEVGYVDLKCPYCGHVNDRVAIETDEVNRAVVFTCDVEEGGCDREFIYRPSVVLSIEIMKISEPVAV